MGEYPASPGQRSGALAEFPVYRDCRRGTYVVQLDRVILRAVFDSDFGTRGLALAATRPNRSWRREPGAEPFCVPGAAPFRRGRNRVDDALDVAAVELPAEIALCAGFLALDVHRGIGRGLFPGGTR